MARIGIFGGSFNPPTNAHLQCAVAASEQLQLDQVVFVPAGIHWNKNQGDDPGTDVRLQLLETALTGYPNFTINTLELQSTAVSTLTQTVPSLHQQSPTDQYWTIIGSDTAVTIESWPNYESILACSRLLVIPRGHQQDKITEQLTAIADSVDYLQADVPPLSSSMIRDRVQQALPIDTLVPPGVAAYITQHGLYANAR